MLRGMLEAQKNNKDETYVFQETNKENTELKNITIRSDGRYMGRVQIEGKRITVYAKTQKQCLQKLKQAERNINNIKEQKTNYMLHDWLNEWYYTYKEKFVGYETAKYIQNIIHIIQQNFTNTKLNLITTPQIQKFLNTFETSRKKEFIILYFKACLQKAVDLDYINKNPFAAIVKEQKLNNIRQGYNLEEQKLILKLIKGTNIENHILFYLGTGIRKNEILTFDTAKHLNEKTKTISILSEKKRKKEIYRTIDITDDMIKIIQQIDFSLKPDYVYRQFKELLAPYKINAGLHKLRHTFATNHFYLGTPTKLISSWLGHETIELTQNIYTHIDRTITKNDILKLYDNLYYKI